MKKFTQTLTTLTAITLLSACGGTDSGNPIVGKLTANMSGATSLALQSSASASTSSMNVMSADTDVNFKLRKINSEGNPEEVFSSDANIYDVKANESIVVVGGTFRGLLDINDNELNCEIIAFSRDAVDESVYCIKELPEEGIGFQEESINALQRFVIAGETVFFPSANYRGTTNTTLEQWSFGDSSSETLLFLGSSAMTHVMISDAKDNLCVVDEVNLRVRCSAIGSTLSWSVIDFGGSTTLQSTFFFKNHLISEYDVLDLSDLSVVNALNGNYSIYYRNKIVFGSNHALGIGDATNISSGDNSLLIWDNDGEKENLETTKQWTHITSVGDVAWAYGESGGNSFLQKIDLANGTLDSTNYLNGVGLIEVSSLALASDSLIKIEGTASSGLPTTVYVDSSSNNVVSVPQELPSLNSIIPLQ